MIFKTKHAHGSFTTHMYSFPVKSVQMISKCFKLHLNETEFDYELYKLSRRSIYNKREYIA